MSRGINRDRQQMTEWENSKLRKTMNSVIHQMRTVQKTITPHKGEWK